MRQRSGSGEWYPDVQLRRKMLRRIGRALAGNRSTLREFADWLEETRGLAVGTIRVRVCAASTFVDAVTSGSCPQALRRLTDRRAEAFFVDYVQGRSVSARRSMATAMRSSLGFAAERGWVGGELGEAVPSLTSYRLARLPRGLGWLEPGTGEPTSTHPVAASAARALLDKSPNERSGVLSTALSFLDLYRDPILAANTEASDFTILDLMQRERPVNLYLTVPSSDLHRTRPLVRMLLNQALRRLTETLEFDNGQPVPHYKQPLLLMLDEFPALGRLAFFQESLAYLAGYGIRAFLITQDLSQHYGVYGREEAITGNCHFRIAFTANKPENAELLSRMAGDMTVHMEQRSYRGDRFDLVLNQQYVAQQQVRRPLLTPDEAIRLPQDDALIFVAGYPPIRAGKVRYWVGG